VTSAEAKDRFGLKADVIEKIQSALAQFAGIDSVILYGSRAKGNYRTGSDIDLTIKTNDRETKNLLFDVIGAIDDLDLIYLFDISIFEQIDNENLIDHIDRVGVEFYQRDRFLMQQQK